MMKIRRTAVFGTFFSLIFSLAPRGHAQEVAEVPQNLSDAQALRTVNSTLLGDAAQQRGFILNNLIAAPNIADIGIAPINLKPAILPSAIRAATSLSTVSPARAGLTSRYQMIHSLTQQSQMIRQAVTTGDWSAVTGYMKSLFGEQSMPPATLKHPGDGDEAPIRTSADNNGTDNNGGSGGSGNGGRRGGNNDEDAFSRFTPFSIEAFAYGTIFVRGNLNKSVEATIRADYKVNDPTNGQFFVSLKNWNTNSLPERKMTMGELKGLSTAIDRYLDGKPEIEESTRKTYELFRTRIQQAIGGETKEGFSGPEPTLHFPLASKEAKLRAADALLMGASYAFDNKSQAWTYTFFSPSKFETITVSVDFLGIVVGEVRVSPAPADYFQGEIDLERLIPLSEMYARAKATYKNEPLKVSLYRTELVAVNRGVFYRFLFPGGRDGLILDLPALRRTAISGTVSRVLLDEGSKSEHWGFVLRTSDGRDIILYRQGTNPLKEDPIFQPFVGQSVVVRGRPGGTYFYVDAIEPAVTHHTMSPESALGNETASRKLGMIAPGPELTFAGISSADEERLRTALTSYGAQVELQKFLQTAFGRPVSLLVVSKVQALSPHAPKTVTLATEYKYTIQAWESPTKWDKVELGTFEATVALNGQLLSLQHQRIPTIEDFGRAQILKEILPLVKKEPKRFLETPFYGYSIMQVAMPAQSTNQLVFTDLDGHRALISEIKVDVDSGKVISSHGQPPSEVAVRLNADIAEWSFRLYDVNRKDVFPELKKLNAVAQLLEKTPGAYLIHKNPDGTKRQIQLSHETDSNEPTVEFNLHVAHPKEGDGQTVDFETVVGLKSGRISHASKLLNIPNFFWVAVTPDEVPGVLNKEIDWWLSLPAMSPDHAKNSNMESLSTRKGIAVTVAPRLTVTGISSQDEQRLRTAFTSYKAQIQVARFFKDQFNLGSGNLLLVVSKVEALSPPGLPVVYRYRYSIQVYPNSQGTGLAIGTVEAVVDAHNGELSLERAGSTANATPPSPQVDFKKRATNLANQYVEENRPKFGLSANAFPTVQNVRIFNSLGTMRAHVIYAPQTYRDVPVENTEIDVVVDVSKGKVVGAGGRWFEHINIGTLPPPQEGQVRQSLVGKTLEYNTHFFGKKEYVVRAADVTRPGRLIISPELKAVEQPDGTWTEEVSEFRWLWKIDVGNGPLKFWVYVDAISGGIYQTLTQFKT